MREVFVIVVFGVSTLAAAETTLHFPVGATVRLTATPHEGYVCGGWVGYPGSDCAVDVSVDAEMTPIFTREAPPPGQFAITLHDASGGVVGWQCISGCPPDVPPPPAEPACGNSVVEPPEECDDANTAGGDGCSAVCAVEASSILEIVDHGVRASSGGTTYAHTTGSIDAGSLLVVAVVSDTKVVVSDEDGDLNLAAESVSEDVSQWNVGRVTILTRQVVAASQRTLTARMQTHGHLRMNAVEVKGATQVGQVLSGRSMTGVIDIGAITTNGPSVLVAVGHSTGGQLAAPIGWQLATPGLCKWYCAAAQIVAGPGVHQVALDGAGGQWVAAALEVR